MTLVATVVSILTTWAALFVSLVGIGSAALRWYTGAHPRVVGDTVWLGYAVTMLFLQLWHLLLPITGLTTVLVIASGVVLAWRYRAAWGLGHLRGWWGLAALAVACWIAVRSMGGVTLYDSGMYHIPFVNWVKTYSIVPGLGNLHGRLGFNPASLLVAAMVDVGPWTDGSQHIANSFLVAAFATHAIARLAAASPPVPLRSRTAFELTMLPAILFTALRQDVRSLSTDLPVFVILAVVGGILFELLVEPGEPTTPDGRLMILLALCGAALCVKLSAAPFAAAAALTGAIAHFRTRSRVRWLKAVAIPAILVTTWLVRGAILTGFPLYPSRLLSLPVGWRVNAEQADAEAAWVTMSARNLNTNVIETSASWLENWIRLVLTRGDLFAHMVAPLLVCVLAAGLLARRRPEPVAWRAGVWMVPSIGVAVVVWWMTAPHTRMAQGPFWLLAATAMACAVGGHVRLTRRERLRLLAGSAALFGLLAGRVAAGEWVRAAPGGRIRAVLVSLGAERSAGGWLVPMPTPDLLRYVTPNGIDLAVPRVDNSCWNGPLLCTPHPSPSLAMRSPGEAARGFRAPREWQPFWFPNPWIPFLAYWRCVRDGGATGRDAREAACRDLVMPPSGG
ncbi:MAG: hypothetical protein MNPFHGCM_02081 [Gemmatimonadaceae bacterium]|nr:hypothetical protein [Gemmatimonadaceae bacterium]